MSSKIKNIIIGVVVIVILILVYIFLIKKTPDEQNLVSTTSVPVTTTTTTTTASSTIDQNSTIARDFLTVLLSVKSIKLNDAIFSDKAFLNLRDSSIVLTPPSLSEEGRTNPFAPIGFEASTVTTTPVTPTTPTAPASALIPGTTGTVKTP